MSRPGQDEDRGRKRHDPGWDRDDAGREVRKLGGTTVYHSQEDRDAALDATFTLDAPARLMLGYGHDEPRNIAGMIMIEAQMLAEWFWKEAAESTQVGLRDKVIDWEIRHFGRELTAGPRGRLMFEVHRLQEHAPRRMKLAAPNLFESYAEQQRYLRAAEEVPPYSLEADEPDAVGHARRILERAEGKPYADVFEAFAARSRAMRPKSRKQREAEANRQKAAIAARVAAERRDPYKDSDDAARDKAPAPAPTEDPFEVSEEDLEWLKPDDGAPTDDAQKGE